MALAAVQPAPARDGRRVCRTRPAGVPERSRCGAGRASGPAL